MRRCAPCSQAAGKGTILLCAPYTAFLYFSNDISIPSRVGDCVSGNLRIAGRERTRIGIAYQHPKRLRFLGSAAPSFLGRGILQRGRLSIKGLCQVPVSRACVKGLCQGAMSGPMSRTCVKVLCQGPMSRTCRGPIEGSRIQEWQRWM